MFRTGYILDPRRDCFWYLALPFLAVMVGLAGQEYLPPAATVSIGLWITVPHHFATWLRAYGFADERQRWRGRLLIGPLFIFGVVLTALMFSAPAVIVLVMLWDHQHGLMQQYGFSRIYDLKAGTGAPSTRRIDLALSWVLYSNLVLTTGFWTSIWVPEFTRWGLGLTPEIVQGVGQASWALTGAFFAFYAGHLVWCVAHGYGINPVKYLFLGASYFLWYFAAWEADTILMYHIAHRLMHGLQYDVMVYSYIRRKVERTGLRQGLISAVDWRLFIGLAAIYTVAYNLVVGHGFEDFAFGLAELGWGFDSLRELGLERLLSFHGYEHFALGVVLAVQATHYFVDSFIWKVSDTRTHQGL